MSFYNNKKGTFEKVVVQNAGDFHPLQTDKLLRAPRKYSCQDSCSTISKFSLDPHSSCYIKRTSRSLDSLIENVPKPKRKYTRRKKLENVKTNNIPKRKYQRKPKHEHVNAVPYGNGCFHSSYSVSTPSLEFDLDIGDFQIDDYKLREERFIEEVELEQKKNALYNDIETVVINEDSDDDNNLAVPNYTKIPENIFSSPVKTKSEKDWLDYFANCEEFITESDLINDAYLPVTLDQHSNASSSSVSALENNLSLDDLLKDEMNLYLSKDFSAIDIDNPELTTFFESKSTQKKYLSDTDSAFSDNVPPNRFVEDQIEHASFNHVLEMIQNENTSVGGNMKDILNSIDEELEEMEKSHCPKLETDVSSKKFETVMSSNDLEENGPFLANNNMSLSKLAIDHTECNQEVHHDHPYFNSGNINVDPEQLTDDIFEKIILNLVKLNFEEIEELQISQHIAADISEKFNITIASNNAHEANNCRVTQHVINENNSGTSLETYDVYLNEPFSNTFGKIDEVVITDTKDGNYDEYVVTDDVNTAVASLEVEVDNNLDAFNMVDNATRLELIHQNENMIRAQIDNDNEHSSLLKRKKRSKLSRNSNTYIGNRLEQVIKSILHKTKLNQTEEFLTDVIKKVVNIFLRYCIINKRQKMNSYKTISKNRLRRYCLPYRKSPNTYFSKILFCLKQILKRLNRYPKNSFVSNLKQTRRKNNNGNVGEQEFDVVERHEEDLGIPNQNALLKPSSNILSVMKNSDVATCIDQSFQIDNSLPDPTTDHFENDKCLLEYTTTKVEENINQKHYLSESIIHCSDNHKCLLKDSTDVEHNFNDINYLTDFSKYDTKNCNNGIHASEAITHGSDNNMHLLGNSNIAKVVDQSVNENSLLNSPSSRSSVDIDQCIKNETCSPEAIMHSSDDEYKLNKSDVATVVDQGIQENSNNTTDINPNNNNENCSPQPISQNTEKPLSDCLALFEPKHGKTVLRDLQNIEHLKCQINNKKTVEPTLKQEDAYMNILFKKSKTITKKNLDNTEHCYGFGTEEIAKYMPMTRNQSQKIKIPYSNVVTSTSNSSKITTREVQQGVTRKVRVLRNRTVITYSNEN